MSNELLLIGEVARRSGKAPSAIRYYESVGLLAEPERISGRRRYPAEVVRSLAVIDTAQRAGLTLDDIRLLLEAEKFAEAFKAKGATYQLEIIPGAPHTFSLQPKERDLRPVVLAFFDKYLKPGK